MLYWAHNGHCKKTSQDKAQIKGEPIECLSQIATQLDGFLNNCLQ